MKDLNSIIIEGQIKKIKKLNEDYCEFLIFNTDGEFICKSNDELTNKKMKLYLGNEENKEKRSRIVGKIKQQFKTTFIDVSNITFNGVLKGKRV